MDKKEMSEIVRMIQNAYPNATFPADKLNSWYEWLKKYDFEQVERNVREHILHSPYQPSIADIVKIAKENNSRRTVDDVEKANADAYAWLERNGLFDED